MQEQNNSVNSLSHSKWRCKYHIVFALKYRRKVFYEEKRTEIREIIRMLCTWKAVVCCGQEKLGREGQANYKNLRIKASFKRREIVIK